MTFYQELQLNQAGSKAVIRNSKSAEGKWRHIAVYLFKIMVTMAFCFGFVTVYSLVFGNDNSIVGVVVLLCLMVFKMRILEYIQGSQLPCLQDFLSLWQSDRMPRMQQAHLWEC